LYNKDKGTPKSLIINYQTKARDCGPLFLLLSKNIHSATIIDNKPKSHYEGRNPRLYNRHQELAPLFLSQNVTQFYFALLKSGTYSAV
tara:strand:- start:978 stop:1241 length:264 start_codon:yes stop_codon:yes gene_type:complete